MGKRQFMRQRVGWIFGVLVVMAGVMVVLLGEGFYPILDDERDSPVYTEQFQVAEPLRVDRELEYQFETITAVTNPTEGWMEEEPAESLPPVASSDEELLNQCQTVLKEIAFCTGEDRFLDLVGTSPNLRESLSDEREWFLDRVKDWFEPGGAQIDCELYFEAGGEPETQQLQMWSVAARESSSMCRDFGQTLLDLDLLMSIEGMWQPQQW